ncbi:MAG: CRISPR-associated endonuclease Cas9 [Catillopecten margaritatus gill symbiont]|uniref:CRISPR-associated endonuclease Cas9 n=1 Tax=Catillopecten margaritatus gill symbiont TaxID=3083288 RepID=A0AAU6PHS3_9GAMM
MSKKVLGLDLGSNSIGWALMSEIDGEVNQIIDLGSRIFNKAVEDKVPTPKNQKRRDMRLGRRVLQRRARRKQRMINYLISLDLLPQELHNNFGQEKLLNELGDPYELRAKGLDEQLTPFELGRVLLHFVARRGFLSSKKQIAGDLVDDPDTQTYLSTLDNKQTKDEEGQFKADIAEVYQAITSNNARTLGEYLFNRQVGEVKRNRSHDGGHLRTDRKMYKDELALIWEFQQQYFELPENFMSEIDKIIFYQRPLKLKKDRVGKCSLEPKHYRANTARLEVQKFRYLQDINNLQYFERHSEEWFSLNSEQKDKLKTYFEHHPKITITALKKELGLDKPTKINLEAKNLKGNVTACEIRDVIGNTWDEYSNAEQSQLFEDLFTIKKKSSLKARLITHWDFDKQTAVKLCLIEFEPSHSNHSLKAIKKLLPFLENGLRYDEARVEVGYGYEVKENEVQDKLPIPPETSNPIVNKGMHELRRVVNAIIKQYGKLDIVRIEMARDLEMNTKRYKANEAQQKKNQKANEEATKAFIQETGKKYPSHDEKIRYRLWKDQDNRCAYSGNTIALGQIFSADCEIDHILPFKKSLDDSYMNKVLCFEKENRNKDDRTPIDAWGGDNDKWNQITQAISHWDQSLKSKIARFYTKDEDLQKRDFISSQLNDTRYISRLAQDYMRQLDCDVNVTKGFVVSQIRHQWGFNDLIGETDKKERTDHRHHAIDAVVIASSSRSLYQQATKQIKQNKLKIPRPYSNIKEELNEKLKHMIVSHTPQRKLSGSLHEETGAGYIAKHGGLVYRKTLNPEFTIKNAMSIVDEQVQLKVLEHIENFGSSKEAFNEENLQQLKLGKNPIKRVRVLQSKIKTTKKQTAEDILQQTKFGVRDKSGKIFKYMSYGNTHHIEIIKNIKTEKITGIFVTMMEASNRIKGINIPKQPVVKTDHGENWEFIMALHINDTVSIEKENGERIFYRVQKLGGGYDITLRLNTASTIGNNEQCLPLMVKGVIENNLIQHKINAIGGLIDD